MKVIRTFVAVPVSEDIRGRVTGVLEQLAKLTSGVKWVAPENLHVTLKFLGGVREDRIGDVCAAVERAIEGAAPFDLSIAGVGAFPNPRRARVVWVGVQEGQRQLAELAERIDAELAKLGFEREKRPFAAHVTIGRVREGRSPEGLSAGIDEADAGELGAQRVASVAVMQSDLRREVPVYTALRVVQLGKVEADNINGRLGSGSHSRHSVITAKEGVPDG